MATITGGRDEEVEWMQGGVVTSVKESQAGRWMMML